MKSRKIELLSPAKNADIGIEAILHGADAVYIGAPQFGARASAGNSVEEIERLVEIAHLYHARVYVALNTILTDEQLPQIEALIHKLYSIDVDAIIVQDMGILELDLPPIAIHASTQTDNRSVKKVQFLESVGFSQVVLARELGLAEIHNIAQNTTVPLEVFIHGALCVSYSGQCYISQAITERSANRGECAQFCRLSYRMEDANGKVMARNKHLLSLKDLNRSESLEALLDAGITSFKIEGRMKDASYVKNVTAYYRQKLDEIIDRREEFERSSSGKSQILFTPSPEKSFNRGFTPYFIDRKSERPTEIWNFASPKSMGDKIGMVKSIHHNHFTVAGIVQLNNGDGLCFINEQGELTGFRVNRVEENRIFPAEMPLLKPKTILYRNWDQEYEKQLSKPSANRRIGIEIELSEIEFGFALTLTDEDRLSATLSFEIEKQMAQSPQKANIVKQLSKLGTTIFHAKSVEVKYDNEWFIPASLLAEWRRSAVEKLLDVRQMARKRTYRTLAVEQPKPYINNKITYLDNVANTKATEFYQRHQVTEIEPAFELSPQKNIPLMFTKHCLKYSFGICPVHQKKETEYNEPFYLVNNKMRFRLAFDCKKCEMLVYNTDPKNDKTNE